MRILTLICAFLFIRAVSPVCGAEKFTATAIPPWGVNAEQVKALDLPGTLAEEDGLHLCYIVKTGGFEKLYFYLTDKSQLGAASIYYAQQETEANQLAVYNALEAELAAKYGAPKYDFGPNEAGKYDPNMAHMVERHAVWDVQKTGIFLSAKHDAAYGGVFLHYTGTDYFEYR